MTGRVNSMLVAFETKSYSRVVFFADVATDLLRAMGKSGDVPGAVLAADVPKALARLRSHIGGPDAQRVSGPAPGAEDEDDEPRVDLATRAFPLIELLSAAAENEDDVVWKRA
jgi:Domain of unknown function (DUF1840)